jgi:hypothetical protein
MTIEVNPIADSVGTMARALANHARAEGRQPGDVARELADVTQEQWIEIAEELGVRTPPYQHGRAAVIEHLFRYQKLGSR